MEIRIRVPHIPSGAVSNILGLLGILAMVVGVGGLTGNVWWSVLTGGVFAVALAALAQAADTTSVEAPAAAPVRGVRAS